MNIAMLKTLVELARGEIDCIDVDAFFARFPRTSTNLKDLNTLAVLKYISVLGADDDIDSIGVNKKALDYFKK